MIRVMVVEDEAPILRSIAKAIETTHSQFTVVAAAYNGKEALDLLETTLVDVLFTDIHMPVMEGIELIANVKSRFPEVFSVVISGYQDFENARKVMSLGIMDYLLKPVSPNELKQLLNKIEEKFANRKELSMVNYIHALVHNEKPEPLRPSREPGYYGIMLLCAGSLPVSTMEHYLAVDDPWTDIVLKEHCRASLEQMTEYWVVNGRTLSEKAVMYFTPAGEPNKVVVEEKAEILFKRLVSDLPVPLTLIYASPFDSIQDVGMKAQQMRSALYRYIRIGHSQMAALTGDPAKDEADARLNDVMERKMTLAIEQNDYALFEAELQYLVGQWKITFPRQQTVENILRQIKSILAENMASPSKYFSSFFDSDVDQAILSFRNYDQLLKYLSAIYGLLFSIRKQNRDEMTNSVELMENLDYYLKMNIGLSINHQMLSDKFGLVPSYLSKLFSNYKGISPAKYLVLLRIERAKEIITANPGILIKDVSALVGYSDGLYFSKIFKKETGIWPTEYQKKLLDSMG